MSCNCKHKLILKSEHAVIKTSPNMSKPVNLALISEGEYGFYSGVFPEAFFVKECNNCKMEQSKTDVDNYINKK